MMLMRFGPSTIVTICVFYKTKSEYKVGKKKNEKKKKHVYKYMFLPGYLQTPGYADNVDAVNRSSIYIWSMCHVNVCEC